MPEPLADPAMFNFALDLEGIGFIARNGAVKSLPRKKPLEAASATLPVEARTQHSRDFEHNLPLDLARCAETLRFGSLIQELAGWSE